MYPSVLVTLVQPAVGSGTGEFVGGVFEDESTGVEDGLDPQPVKATAVPTRRLMRSRGNGVLVGALLH